MKFLIIFILILPIFAQANWVPKSKFKSPDRIYSKERKCVQRESDVCYDISGIDIRRFMIGMVDDLSSPNYVKRDVEACSDQDSCNLILATKDCSAYPEGSLALINVELTEVYCAELTGYAQIEGVAPDPAGSAAADAEDAAKAAEETARRNAKSTRDADLKQCIRDGKGNMNNNQLQSCLMGLVKEVLDTRVDVNDL